MLNRRKKRSPVDRKDAKRVVLISIATPRGPDVVVVQLKAPVIRDHRKASSVSSAVVHQKDSIVYT